MYRYLDLRGTPCPVNFVRCRLALEQVNKNQILQVDIDKGEPQEMVLPALRDEGYDVQIILDESDWVRFNVIADANQ